MKTQREILKQIVKLSGHNTARNFAAAINKNESQVYSYFNEANSPTFNDLIKWSEAVGVEIYFHGLKSFKLTNQKALIEDIIYYYKLEHGSNFADKTNETTASISNYKTGKRKVLFKKVLQWIEILNAEIIVIKPVTQDQILG